MADNQIPAAGDQAQNGSVGQNQQQNATLIQSQTQEQQNTAPMPEWLQKAQLLAQHEEQAPQSPTVPTQPLVTATEQAESAQQIVQAPLPEWLEKAAQQAVGGQTISVTPSSPSETSLPSLSQNSEPMEQNVSVPVVPAANEKSVAIEVPSVQKETTILPQEVPLAAEAISNSNQPISQEKELIPNPPQTTVITDTSNNPLLEPATSSASISQTVTVPSPSTTTPAVTQTAHIESAPPTPAVPSNPPAPQSKKEIFELAKDTFLSALDKGQSVIKEHQNAGVPKQPINDVEESPSASISNSSPSKKDNQNSVSSIQNSQTSIKENINPATSDKPLSAKDTKKATAEEKRQLIEAEKIYQQGITTIRDLIAPSSMEIRYDSIRVEGMYAQSFFVYAYPRYLDSNWLSPIVNFDVTMDISQFIYPIESATIMRILKKKVAQMQASVHMNASKGMVSDPALETALQDAEELRTQIQRGQEKLFQFALYFTLYSEDEKKIQKIAKQLESILGAKLILTKRAELQAEHGFNSTLPLCLDELEVIRNMNTSPLSSTFPFSSSDLTSNEGILYGLNRHNDSLIIFDRFSLENANSVVFAKSGAGKSYCVKLEVLRSMMLGTDVIIIDPEGEYKDLAQTVGGSYLRVSLTSDRRINPFDLPSAIQDEELQPGDLLRSNIINLHGLLKIMLGGVTPEEEGILDKALNDVYALKGITMDMVDPSKIPPPTMEDLYDILSTMEGGVSLSQRLQKYTSGTYSGIFNKPTNIDMSSGLMVFSIRDLEDALRPIAMYIILNFIWNRVRSQLKKRILVIDEAWTMMQYEDSAKFMFGLVKRARKYYLGITTITQDVEDFMKSPYGKPVVTNSSMQVLLKQAPAAIEILSKTFNLTEGERYMLLNSGVGQGLFFAGLKHVAIQIIASYTEDKIITTNPEEVLQNKEEVPSV